MTSKTILTGMLLALGLAGTAHGDWSDAASVEGVIGCKLNQQSKLVVSFAHVEADGRRVRAGLRGKRCSEALASFQRRMDLRVEPLVGGAPGAPSMVFDLSSPDRMVSRVMGCSARQGKLVVDWVDGRGNANPAVGLSCVRALQQARRHGLRIGARGAEMRADHSEGDEQLVFSLESGIGRPDRARAILGCRLSAADELLASFVDASPAALDELGPLEGQDCATVRAALARFQQLRAAAPVAAAPGPDHRQRDHLYFHLHTNAGSGVAVPPEPVSCAILPESAPAGDLLIVSDENGRVVREEPLPCALMGNAYTADARHRYEVVISAELVRLGGGAESFLRNAALPIDCRRCWELKGITPPEPGEIPVDSPGWWFYNVVPDKTETLGTLFYAPTHPNGWHRGQNPDSWWSQSLTSYCAGGPLKYGMLTNLNGWEIEPAAGGGGKYGGNAYQMWDPVNGWIRGANVGFDGTLKLPAPFDICGF